MTPMAATARQRWGDMAVAAPATSPLLTLGFLAFCFYVFAFYSRILDIGGGSLHLPAIAFTVAIAAAVLSGRVVDVLQDRIAAYLVGLTLCIVIAIPGSFWRSGSLKVLTANWIPSMMLFLVGGAVIGNFTECRRTLYVTGIATAAGALLVMLRGRVVNERLELSGSSYANSNTIAIMLLLGMPLVWLMSAGSRAGLLRKTFVGGLLILMLGALFRSGSREGLIGLAVIFAIAFLRSSILGKLKLVVAMVAMLAGMALFVPRSLLSRFETIFQGTSVATQVAQTEAERKLLVAAGGSSQARLALLLDSLNVTMHHPLLGVGPGQYTTYSAHLAESRNRYGLWIGTHNTYTQVSSEVGIPALCFYVAVLVSSIAALRRIYRRARRIPGKEAHDIALTALALHTSFITYCVCAMFNHMAFEPTMPLMAAVAVAMRRTVPAELNRLEDAEKRQDAAPESFLTVLPNRSRFVAEAAPHDVKI